MPRQVLRNASTSSQRGFQAHSRTAVLNAGARPGSANAGGKGFNWSLLAGAAFATTASAAMISRNAIHCGQYPRPVAAAGVPTSSRPEVGYPSRDAQPD